MSRFVDREEELALLEAAWHRPSAGLVVLYGRRRVGKSRLLQEFLRGKDGFHVLFEDTSQRLQLDDLRARLADHLEDDFLRRTPLGEWRDLFAYLAKTLPRRRRLCIALDEFSYAVKNDRTLVPALQHFWDSFLSRTRVLLVLSGSLLGLMTDEVLASSSPLYGRRTRDILLRPLRFADAGAFLRMPRADRLKVYLTVGGVPEYLLKASGYRTAGAFLRAEFFGRHGYFLREPHFVLSQEFRDVRTYFAIVQAIATGATHPAEIANAVGIQGREIYPYLENLIRLEIVARETPAWGSRKRGTYLLRDAVFDSWFNLVYPRRERIEAGDSPVDVQAVDRLLGKRFEWFVRTEGLRAVLPEFEVVGPWWHAGEEIDFVAWNAKTRDVLLGECKWGNRVDADAIVRGLQRKAEVVDRPTGSRTHYAVVAGSFRRGSPNALLIRREDMLKALDRR
ncbi:MAG: hypothetical protein A2V88_04715 [Elusimicrobia bacterium RBG_16_66_12]|nr:MAG: hypothetical protein A2V88_04715 [Elusimicrobia bacterium RBG_16_66_12]